MVCFYEMDCTFFYHYNYLWLFVVIALMRAVMDNLSRGEAEQWTGIVSNHGGWIKLFWVSNGHGKWFRKNCISFYGLKQLYHWIYFGKFSSQFYGEYFCLNEMHCLFF